MPHRKPITRFDNQTVRDWTLYVIKLDNGHYYIGITSRRDFMRRIREHGGRFGASINRHAQVDEIVEIQHLGKMRGKEAQQIENDMTLLYRKQFGARNVRGGYDISKTTSLVPAYTPGSTQSLVFIATSLVVAILLLLVIVWLGN